MNSREVPDWLKTAQDEFALRYYRWSFLDSQRELAAEFPLVRTVRSSRSALFLEFAEGEGREHVWNLMTGGIKRFNPRGAELAGDTIAADEDSARQRYLAFTTPEIELQGRRMTSARLPARVSEVRERELRGETSTHLDKRQFARLIKTALEPVFGRPEKALTGGLHYCVPVGSWFLMTAIDLSGQYQLAYSHEISARPLIELLRPNHLQAGISLLSWCGIHQMTRFDLIEESQTAEAAKAIGAICAHFQRQVSPLIEGLPNPTV